MEVNITAKSVEEFKEIERKMDLLHKNVSNNIFEAKKSHFETVLKVKAGEKNTLTLPIGVTELQCLDGVVNAYFDSYRFICEVNKKDILKVNFI